MALRRCRPFDDVRFVFAGFAIVVACSPFTAEPAPSTSTPSDAAPPTSAEASILDSAAGPIDAGDEGDAPKPAAFECPTPALQCETFSGHSYEPAWDVTPMLGFMKLASSADAVHGGVGYVDIGAKTWTSPATDALGGSTQLDAIGQTPTLDVDFLVRVDELSGAQDIELAKIAAEHLLVHVNLTAAGTNDVAVSVAQYSIDRTQDGPYTFIASIKDHGWHRVHLELSTSQFGQATNRYRARLDNQATDALEFTGEDANKSTNQLSYLIGVSYVLDFKAPIKYAIDEITVTSR